MEPEKSMLIEVSGTVQGVGFRFFVLNLAKKFNLKGYVRNTGLGAQALVQGDRRSIEDFISELKEAGFEARYEQKEVPADEYKDFRIAETVR